MPWQRRDQARRKKGQRAKVAAPGTIRVVKLFVTNCSNRRALASVAGAGDANRAGVRGERIVVREPVVNGGRFRGEEP